MSNPAISNEQLILAALLILFNLGLSVLLKLDLERNLFVASLRMTVQLLIIGYALNWIFALRSPMLIVLVGGVMATLASVDAANRMSRRFSGIYLGSLGAVLLSSFLVTGLTLAGILHLQPWFQAQYAIPILGMVLGNTITGISLAGDRFLSEVVAHRDRIESLLAMGATRWEAAHAEIRTALRTGMIPTINAMMVMGLVSLPGMMTGQILAGAPPAIAVRYQIVIMFVIASATALGAFGMVWLAFRALFDEQHRLRPERLRAPRKK